MCPVFQRGMRQSRPTLGRDSMFIGRTSKTAQPDRRRVQYRLRTLFAWMTCLAVLAAILGGASGSLLQVVAAALGVLVLGWVALSLLLGGPWIALIWYLAVQASRATRKERAIVTARPKTAPKRRDTSTSVVAHATLYRGRSAPICPPRPPSRRTRRGRRGRRADIAARSRLAGSGNLHAGATVPQCAS